jgi:hypothetical protein
VPEANYAAVTFLKDDETLVFDPAKGFIDFPGGMTKFTIRFDDVTRRYISLSNEVYNFNNPW